MKTLLFLLAIVAVAAPEQQPSQSEPAAARRTRRRASWQRRTRRATRPRATHRHVRGQAGNRQSRTAHTPGVANGKPERCHTNPGIGAVTARGSKQIWPSTTTAYTLSMKGGPTRTITVTVEGSSPRAAAAEPRATSGGIRRLPDGKPDLSGVYGSAGLPQGTTPPPLKPGAEKFRIVREDRTMCAAGRR